MKIYDVVILTEERYENPSEINDYIQNVLTEDGLLLKSLENLGLKVIRKNWNDENFDWSTCRFAIFRTTWDYFDKFSMFKTWFDRTKEKCTFINSADIIMWNMDKNYLSELELKGINIPKTTFIKSGTTESLQSIFDSNNYSKAVLKPTVSGGGRHTYKIKNDNIQDYENLLSELLENEDMMLQEFQNNIVTQGEFSLIIIGGKYTHSVLKIAKPGDFRVQDDFGGSVHHYEPKASEIEFAEKCIQACSEKPLYARVDLFYDNDNKLALGELELIEPELWFRNCHESAKSLAIEIKKLC